MNYKVVAFDLDGTLLDSKKAIKPESKAVIQQLQQQGVQVVLVTGRHHTAVYPYIDHLQLTTPAICCNGTYLYDFSNKKVLASTPYSKQQALDVLKSIREFGIHTMVYVDDAMTYETMNSNITSLLAWGETLPARLKPNIVQVADYETMIESAQCVWKFTTSAADIQQLTRFVEYAKAHFDVSCEWSWVDRVDVAQSGNSKGNRLAQWVKSQGLTMESVVAFGDNENDMSMLQLAGWGIAMGNSEPVVQTVAKQVIGDNNSTTIAETLKAIFHLA